MPLLQSPDLSVCQSIQQRLAQKRLCGAVDSHHHIQIVPGILRQVGSLHTRTVFNMPGVDFLPVKIIHNNLEIFVGSGEYIVLRV